MKRYKKILLALAVCTFAVPSLVFATTSVTEQYASDDDLKPGNIVSLEEESNTMVELATKDNVARLFGIVQEATDNDIRLEKNEEDASNYFITTLGVADVFVSDINGAIKVGDEISVSPIAGVGQRAIRGDSQIIGTATESFNDKSVSNSTTELVNSEGDTVTASLGRITVQVQPGAFQSNSIPDYLASFGEDLAGKPVSSFRVFVALAVMTITLTSSATLLFSAIRSAIISIGRNPLSKSPIYRGLFQVMGITGLIFVAGLVGSYLILTV